MIKMQGSDKVLTNYHTHSVFCDGNDTLEEVVKTAIEKNFKAIGFSGHGYTDYDFSYCMKDTEGYISEVKHLREKYKSQIQIYLGIEEDMYSLVDRTKFDYMIGSCHYIKYAGEYYPIDLNYQGFQRILSLFGNNPLALAEHYYSAFCDYILTRKPDIIGHFDLITKFEEIEPMFFGNLKYIELSKHFLLKAIESDCIFEINTGAIARGYRTAPYPHESLLYELRQSGAKIILSSDCHNKTMLDCNFDTVLPMLRDIGFKYVYNLYDGEFKQEIL